MLNAERFADDAGYRDLLAHLPPGTAAEVDEAMGQPHRRYHTRWHLGRMWRLHREQGRDAWSESLMWAIAYHDIVYEAENAPKRNEFESAACFLRAAHTGGLGLEAAARITGWILASADHLGAGTFIAPDGDPVGTWFLDLDLEPLASEAFTDNTALIREEFRHVPDEAFKHGRSAFLAGILEHPAIFRTDAAARLGWEAAARRNIVEALLPRP
ncbi:hypothetical protein [Roseococcus sp.]|uniref:HD domain-containing protein n=1 Tax=Roseococcus sp. TaxID=2109646 RepID=UPI003BAD44A8